MTNENRISVEMDADCVWALQQIADTTGESPHAILRVAIGQAWKNFATRERLCREAAIEGPGATTVPGHTNVVDLENHGKKPWFRSDHEF